MPVLMHQLGQTKYLFIRCTTDVNNQYFLGMPLENVTVEKSSKIVWKV